MEVKIEDKCVIIASVLNPIGKADDYVKVQNSILGGYGHNTNGTPKRSESVKECAEAYAKVYGLGTGRIRPLFDAAISGLILTGQIDVLHNHPNELTYRKL